MDLRLQFRCWAVNVSLFLFGLYAVLAIFTLVNLLNIPYFPFTGELPGKYIMHLILFSPYLDQNILYVLSAVVLLFPWLTYVWKDALGRLLLSALFLILRLVLHLLGAPVVGEVFLILAGFTSLVIVLSASPSRIGLCRSRVIARFLIYSCFIILAIEILSLVCLSLYPSNPYLPQDRSWWRFVELENQMFQVPSTLITIIFTLTLLSWVTKPLWAAAKWLPKWGTRIRRKISKLGSWLLYDEELDNKRTEGWKSKSSVIILSGSAAFTILYILYAFVLGGGLTENVKWSWDMENYVQMLNEIAGQEGVHPASYAFLSFPDRAVSLLFMYAAWQITGSSVWTVVKFAPMLLAPLLSLAVFFFTRQAIRDSFDSSLAALFTVFSFQIIVGFGVAYLSNWMALILLYLSSGLLYTSLRQRSWKWTALAASTMILLLFTHAYTWVMLMGVLAVFTIILGVKWFRGNGSLFGLKAVGVTIATNLSADLIKNLLLSATIAVASETTHAGLQRLAWQNISQFWSTAYSTFHSWMEFYNNPVLLFFALVGAFFLLCRGKRYNVYLLSFFVAASVPFILGDHSMQLRILYNLPLQILALFGLISINQIIQMHVKPREGKILAAALIVLFLLINVNYALRSAVYIARHMHPI